jgi:hypothetical protein
MAECTRLGSTTNNSPNHSWANVPVHTSRSHRSLVEWEEVKMEDVRVAAAEYYFISAYNYYLTYSLLQSDIVIINL